MCIILYADDILLLEPSVNALQLLLSTCELELRKLDLFINSAKSVCLRFGPRRSNNCSNLVTIDGNSLNWESCIRTEPWCLHRDRWAFQMFPRGGQEKILQFIQRNFWQDRARSLGRSYIKFNQR